MVDNMGLLTGIHTLLLKKNTSMSNKYLYTNTATHNTVIDGWWGGALSDASQITSIEIVDTLSTLYALHSQFICLGIIYGSTLVYEHSNYNTV